MRGGTSESTVTAKGTSANSTATATVSMPSAMGAEQGTPDVDASLPSDMEADKDTPDVEASLPSAMGAEQGTPDVDASLPSDMEADKDTPDVEASLPSAMGAEQGTPDVDASLPSDMEADKDTPDVEASLPSAMEADKRTPDVDASLPTGKEAAKGTTAKVLLATDLEAGKGTTAKDSLRTDVDPSKGTNTKESLADNIDGDAGELPTAATAAPSPPILDVAVPLALKFDINTAETLIGKKDWQGIDDLLCKFLGDCLGKDSQDAVIIHPGLLLIPREEKVMELIQNNAIYEATIFCQEFIEPLKKCESEFKPLSLEWRIADLTMILEERSAPTRSNLDVGRAISDYMYLYFPRAMCNEPNHVKEGPWQFAMKLPVKSNQASSTGKRTKSRHGFRCLACGWTAEGTMSITALTNHIIHVRDGKCCPNVTQDMLDRVKLIGNAKDVPDLNTIATVVKNKKRKGPYSGLAGNQNTGSSQSAACESPFPVVHSRKKLKVTPPTESHTRALSLAAAAEVLVANASSYGLEKMVSENVDILRGIAEFILEIQVSLDPDISAACRNKAIELEQVAFELKVATVNSRPHTSLPAQNNAICLHLLQKIVSEKVNILRGIADFILEIEVSLDPDISAACRNKAIELEKVSFELKVATVNSRPHTSLPAQNIALIETVPSSEMPAQKNALVESVPSSEMPAQKNALVESVPGSEMPAQDNTLVESVPSSETLSKTDKA